MCSFQLIADGALESFSSFCVSPVISAAAATASGPAWLISGKKMKSDIDEARRRLEDRHNAIVATMTSYMISIQVDMSKNVAILTQAACVQHDQPQIIKGSNPDSGVAQVRLSYAPVRAGPAPAVWSSSAAPVPLVPVAVGPPFVVPLAPASVAVPAGQPVIFGTLPPGYQFQFPPPPPSPPPLMQAHQLENEMLGESRRCGCETINCACDFFHCLYFFVEHSSLLRDLSEELKQLDQLHLLAERFRDDLATFNRNNVEHKVCIPATVFRVCSAVILVLGVFLHLKDQTRFLITQLGTAVSILQENIRKTTEHKRMTEESKARHERQLSLWKVRAPFL